MKKYGYITFNMDAKLKERLKAYCKRNNTTMTAFISEAIAEELGLKGI
jgi:predicted DNA-binding protein